MELTQKTLCITSYNSTGLGIGAQNFISTLSLFSNILCIQEHFLLDSKSKTYSNTDKLRKLYNDKYDMFIVPAVKDESQVSKGRGKGGLATMWDKNLTKYVSQIKCSNFRLQVTRFDFPSGSFLLLNTYFPCDPRVYNFNEEELLVLLAEIRNVMRMQACVYNMILGDLNSHFSRQTQFTNIIINFFNDIDFLLFWENTDQAQNHLINEIDFTYQHLNNGEIFLSTIDHFASNRVLYNSVIEADVVHSGENPSNHSPIFAKVALDFDTRGTETAKSERKVNWEKSTSESKDLYFKSLSTKLEQLSTPECVECRDVHCIIHTDQLEEYTMSVLEAVQTAAVECLACTGGNKKGPRDSQILPGWTEYVKPYSEESKFWFAMWQSAGKPRTGALFEAMLYSKRQYKYAIRRLKRANHKIQNDKYVESIISGGVNIFREIKKHRGGVKTFSSRIDDQVGAKNIANKFSDIYSKLYNQHVNDEELADITGSVSASLGSWSLTDADRITVNVVKKALKKMKNGKNDAEFNFQSDCLTQGPDILVEHLTNILKSLVVHGSVPHFVLICSLLPLVKDNLADITSSENYRAIASESLLLKLLDILILELEGDKLSCDQLQFGFQAGASTSMCTWTATTVIEHYNRQGRPVYACAMDLSKASDLVEWESLFKLLWKKGISTIFIRILIYIYSNQSCNVKWNSSFSEKFYVSNGVRQGAVSSPLFFSIYIDGMISILRESGLGCKIDLFYYGVLGYADDLLLMSASRSGLQAMVNLCETYAKVMKLKFSTNVDPVKSKTKCLAFSKVKNLKERLAPIILNGNPLPWVDRVKHLGNILESDNSMRADCLAKRGKFIGKVNSLLQEFSFVESSVMVRILAIYVTAFYGSTLWNLYSSEVTKLFSSWNVTMRKVFELPWTTHRFFIEAVSGISHPKSLLCSRLLKFLGSLKTSIKGSVRYLANMVYNDRRTLVGNTVSRIALECKVERCSLSHQAARNMKYYPPLPGDEWKLGLLQELLEVRDGKAVVPGVSQDEIVAMIEEICCN